MRSTASSRLSGACPFTHQCFPNGGFQTLICRVSAYLVRVRQRPRTRKQTIARVTREEIRPANLPLLEPLLIVPSKIVRSLPEVCQKNGPRSGIVYIPPTTIRKSGS